MKGGARRGEQPVVPRAEVRSYYDRPVLKPPVWKWMVPAYFFTGGLAGVSSTLALGGRLTRNERLARQSRRAALGSIGVSAALLVADLGRPGRFANMLRVMKPTSPMSAGSWLLAAYGTAAGAAAAADAAAVMPRLGAAADAAAAALGPALATYTAVLIGDTAVPAWHGARRELPFVFAGSAAASAGGLAVALGPPEAAGAARRAVVGGTVLELAAFALLLRRLRPPLDDVYRSGGAGALKRSSLLAGLTGAGLVAVAGRRRLPAAVGGMAAMAGSALMRFAVFEAGKASTLDPRYVVGPQRERLDAVQPAAPDGVRS